MSEAIGQRPYTDALCPGCGVVLTGSREPGDRDYCQDAEREVTLVPANKNPESVPLRAGERTYDAIRAYRNDRRRWPVDIPPGGL